MSTPYYAKSHVKDLDPKYFGLFTACGRAVEPGMVVFAYLNDWVSCVTCKRALGKGKLPTAKEAIASIEETDYKFVGMFGRSTYLFRSEVRPVEFREMFFSLTELRHAAQYGF